MLKNKNEIGGPTLLDSKMHYKGLSVWYWHKDQ